MSSHLAFLMRQNEKTEAGLRERIATLEAENERLREAAEDVYSPWSCGEPLDREMRELGRALGFNLDPA